MRRALVILYLISLSACTFFNDKHHTAEVSSSIAEDPGFNPQLSNILQVALEKSDRFQETDIISASLYISDQCHWEGTIGTTKQDPGIWNDFSTPIGNRNSACGAYRTSI